MPPIRTEKQNTASAQTPLTGPSRTSRKAMKGVRQGQKWALFITSDEWASQYDQIIGPATRKISFSSDFVLTDNHINDIVGLGKLICKGITQFIFAYEDGRNDAKAVTDDSVIRLAKACRNLTDVRIPGTTRLTDESLIRLLEYCGKLTNLKLSGTDRGPSQNFTTQPFDELREDPQLAPKLGNLVLRQSLNEAPFMRALALMSRKRQALGVVLLARGDESGDEIMS